VSPDKESILLGKRKVYPQPDWWLIGGRSRPGQSPSEAASSNVRRELKIDAKPERFKVVGSYNLVWDMREQEPKNNGTCDISTVHALVLTEEEFRASEKSMFEKKEYTEVNWTSINTILQGQYNPALQQFVRDLCARFKFEKLFETVNRPGASDKDIADIARDLIKLHGPPESTSFHSHFNERTREYKVVAAEKSA